MQYRTIAGDRLDIICGQHYGFQSGAVEKVLDANPHLDSHGAILPAGVLIELPTIAPPQSEKTVRLWD